MENNSLIIDNQQINWSSTNLIAHLPCIIGIKNSQSAYVAGNLKLAQITGFKLPKDMIGLKDADLKCEAAKLYSLFEQQDKQALTRNEQLTNLDITKYSDGKTHVFLSSKKKIIDDNNNHFILFTMSELPINKLAKLFTGFTNLASGSEVMGSYIISNPEVPTEDNSSTKLTDRQAECLFYLLRGKTMKEIASALNLSPKTIETHLEKLKKEFKCYSKSALIAKAFSLGFAQIIPPSLLLNN